MAKIDLKQSSGLPLFYSGEDLQPQGLTINKTSVITIDDMRSQLLNEDLTCPEIFYKRYLDIDKDYVFKDRNLKVNLLILFPNLAGIEYTKTLATRCSKYPRLFETVYGGGTILIQKYESAIKNTTYKLQAKKGEKFIIPAGYTSTIVNTRQNANLIILEISSRQARPRIVLDDRSGMTYYVIRKNAKQEIVRNPKYKIANEPVKISFEKVLPKYGITSKTPIVKQVMRKYEKFEWLFKEDSVDISTN